MAALCSHPLLLLFQDASPGFWNTHYIPATPRVFNAWQWGWRLQASNTYEPKILQQYLRGSRCDTNLALLLAQLHNHIPADR